MAESYRSIYDKPNLRPSQTRLPKPGQEERVPTGQVRVRDDAGLPGTDRGDAKSRRDRLLEEIEAAISATRRRGGLAGGPSEGGVDLAIEQKLKQSGLLGYIAGALLTKNAPKWGGSFPAGSPFALQGLAKDWVAGDGGTGDAGASDGGYGDHTPGKSSGRTGQTWGTEEETFENLPGHEPGGNAPGSAQDKYPKEVGKPEGVTDDDIAKGIFVVLLLLVAAWVVFGPKDVDPNEWVYGDGSSEVPDFETLGTKILAGKYDAALMDFRASGRISGEWVFGAASDESSSAAGAHSVLEALLGMKPGEWVWTVTEALNLFGGKGATANSGLT